MEDWQKIPDDATIEKTVVALRSNNIDAVIMNNGVDAAKKVFEFLPMGAEVMNMTSVTLDTIGVAKEITESGKYNSVRKKLMSMNRETQGLEMQKLGAAPEWVIGSVHAVTEDGKILIASNSGSQLPAYIYASSHVIWVVGFQKIVRDQDQAFKRIYEYCLPKESERFKKIYGRESNVSKIAIINKEIKPGRITMILVKEVLGF